MDCSSSLVHLRGVWGESYLGLFLQSCTLERWGTRRKSRPMQGVGRAGEREIISKVKTRCAKVGMEGIREQIS